MISNTPSPARETTPFTPFAPPRALGAAGILFALTAAGLLAACGEPAPPPTTRTVACTLRWTGPADLDLTIDGTSATRLGGSPDMTHGGGSESFNINETEARETVVVGVANRSAEPGGSGDTAAFATISLVRHDGSTFTIEHAMDTRPWNAAVVHPKSGAIEPSAP